MALVGIAVDYGIELISNLMFSEISYINSFEMIKLNRGWELSAASSVIFRMVDDFLYIVCYFIVGYFIGALHYRMNMIQKILVYAGAPILLFIAFPIYVDICQPQWAASLFRFIVNLLSTPLGYSSIIGVITVVFGTLAFLLMRRAPLKTL